MIRLIGRIKEESLVGLKLLILLKILYCYLFFHISLWYYYYYLLKILIFILTFMISVDVMFISWRNYNRFIKFSHYLRFFKRFKIFRTQEFIDKLSYSLDHVIVILWLIDSLWLIIDRHL